MTDNTLDFRLFFEGLPGTFLILQPDAPRYTIVAANDEGLRITNKLRQDVIGKSIFEVYPENPDEITATGPSHIRDSLDTVMRTKKQNRLPDVRYDVLNREGVFEARYWSPLHKPILNKEGEVQYIIHAPTEVTEQVKAEKKQQELRKIERSYQLFMQSPVAVFIVSGPEHIIELANDEMLKVLDKTSNIIGKPFFECLPDLATQEFPKFLDQVRKTGTTFHANEYPARHIIEGKEELRYYNFIYQAYFANPADQVPKGVICVANNVTEQVLAKKKIEESAFRFRNLIEETPVPTSLLKGKEFIIEIANEAMIGILGKGNSVLGKSLFKALPELEGQAFRQVLDEVFTSGTAYEEKAAKAIIVKDGVPLTFYVDYTYKPLIDADGAVYAIINTAVDVTDKVLAEKHLLEEKAYLQNAIDIGELGTFRVDTLNNTFTYSETIRQWFDLPDLEQSIEALVSRVHPDDTFLVQDVLSRSTQAKENTRHDIIYRVIAADSTIRYLRSIGKTIFNDGRLESINGLLQNVSLQLGAQQRLQESESRFRSMIQQAPIGICLTRGREVVYESINAPMLQLIEKSSEDEVLGKKIADVVPEVISQSIYETVVRVFDTGEPFTGTEFPVQLMRKGSMQLYYLNLSYTPLVEEGKITGVLHVASDVTEQVLSRKRLEESQEELKRFKFMADQARDAFLLIRADGTFAYLNPKALDILGYTEEEAKRLRVSDMDPIYQHELFSETFALALKGKLPQVKTIHKRKDGSTFPVEGSLAGLVLNGEPYLFAVARDITERKQTEETMERKNAELVRINNDLDNFIYTASHDLKAPISNIESLLQALFRTLPKESLASERAQRITNLMQDSIDRFKKTIANLTEIIKLQKDNNEDAVSVNLDEVIKEVMLDLDPLIQSTEAVIDINTEDCFRIYFSEKNLRSVIYNLLSNGIKYRSPARVPKLIISCKKLPNYHVLIVSDNGLGLKENQLTRLFTMFKRFHNHVEGTGIGLYMVKKIVENVGGHIEVESKEDKGTTFNIYFPA